MERGSRQSSLQVPTGVSVSAKVLGLSEGFHVYVSLFRDTRMCNQPGVDSFQQQRDVPHGDTHRHTPRSSGVGVQQVPALRLPLVAGWLPPCGRAFGGQHCLPRYQHPQHTRRHRTRPAPPPRAECSERRGEACSAVTGSQVVGCRVTWGMATHTA